MKEEEGRLHGRLAWSRLPGRGPGVVFLPGFRSDMQGSKAIFLRDHCAARGQAFLRLDYSGHGASDGRFVGSSMGGWIALLVARQRAARLAGLVGIAPAPDFTEALLWPALPAEMRQALTRDGIIHLPSQYGEPTPVTRALIEDGKRQSVLSAPIDLPCPVRILQGMADPDVPWRHAIRIMDTLVQGDARVTLIKDGDHRLSRPEDLRLLAETLDGLLP
jgi:pimeloyl-ACP methyl ester carboxylesterase